MNLPLEFSSRGYIGEYMIVESEIQSFIFIILTLIIKTKSNINSIVDALILTFVTNKLLFF